MTCANSAPPLGLSWENITVSTDGRALTRGIGVAIGTPQQVFSLRPSLGDSNIWVYNAINCGSDKNASCIGLNGGIFNSSKSSTYAQTIKTQWNGTIDTNSVNEVSFIYFNDVLNYGKNGSNPGFPLLVNQEGYGTAAGLGIGPNSTFLDAVVTSGAAPTKAFGLWTGSRSIVEPVDGSLWVGGKDSSRIDGSLTKFPTTDTCWSCAEITNLTYVTSTGSTSLFSNSSETLPVAFEPFSRYLEIPSDIFSNFIRATNGTVGTDTLTNGLGVYSRSAILGNLSVTLSNGYKTVIPAQELFLPPRNYSSDGVYSIADNSRVISLALNTTADPGYRLSWGIPFLTMNYMVFDYENGFFQMAPAKQGSFGANAVAQVDPLCNGAPAVTSSAIGAPSSTSSPFVTSTPAPSGGHSNTGAIAGGVVGGVLGLALIGVLIFFLTRFMRKTKTLQEERDTAIAGHQDALNRSEVVSQYTATSPTEVSEVPDNKGIDSWLYSQRQSTQSPPPHHDISNTMTPQPMSPRSPHTSATLNEPLEMPAYAYR